MRLYPLLFILLLIGTFGFTIFTLYRQKKLSELKTDFINNLTHEFKTPIFSISLAAKSLKVKSKNGETEHIDTYTDRNFVGTNHSIGK